MYRATNGEYNTFLATEYDVEKGPVCGILRELEALGYNVECEKTPLSNGPNLITIRWN